MAALSPATSNHATTSIPPLTAATATNASRNLRGLNKPKCIQCGNVARSRCPFQSCKSCCAKAQNPCHIHVLKSSTTFQDKTTSPSSSIDQQSNEASPSGNSHRFTSLRQLSSNFAQFNNLQSNRSRKPLTRKEAATINEWRFLKLKEYKESNIETENEAFARYMQNVSLLEEVLAVDSTAKESTNGFLTTTEANVDSAEDNNDLALAGAKSMLRSNPARSEFFRKRLGDVINEGLRKLRKVGKTSVVDILNKPDEHVGKQEKGNAGWAERTLVYNDLLDKLNKARNEEDLNSCSEMASQLFEKQLKSSGQVETEDTEKQESAENEVSVQSLPDNFPPKWFKTVTVNQDDLNRIDEGFPSAEKVEML